MILCSYIYCNGELKDEDDECPICSGLKHKNFIDKLPLKLIDMHQILPNESDILQVQINKMNLLNIKIALIQSVPNKVQSILNNKDLIGINKISNNRFIISQFIDPRYILAKKRIQKYTESGIRVIKVLPVLGYEPNNKRFDRFWKQLESNKMIVMVHTGFITARHKEEEIKHKTFMNSELGNPLLFDVIARKFPNLQIILCHIGGSIFYEEAAQMIYQHDNVWGDLSGSGMFALDRILAKKVKLNWNKVFWGNDSHPKFYEKNIKIMLSILKKHKRTELTEKLFFENANKFFKKSNL
ncbi:amidohydrolase family protein [Zobellia nedashkovskayae]|uniref:amidohydrolase family protein n=1 Tax=Zobellia nedashkovskayae TaxID=2779510 RepID=UPI00188ADB31|nr:amidohydrolase family protein [Zobellia nedashkovskayae]